MSFFLKILLTSLKNLFKSFKKHSIYTKNAITIKIMISCIFLKGRYWFHDNRIGPAITFSWLFNRVQCQWQGQVKYLYLF